MQSLSHKAMLFAREKHAGHVKKYTGEPYHCHLAEVVAISMSCGWHLPDIHPDKLMATAWLHDVVEDCGVSISEIVNMFGHEVGLGVAFLSDLETGNRAVRKRLSRERLSNAPGWVQTIKCADLISNTTSIAAQDPVFARVYLEEKRALLDVMRHGDPHLLEMARSLAGVAA